MKYQAGVDGGERERVDGHMVDKLLLFGIEDGEGWKPVALEPGKRWEIVDGSRSIMATRWKEEERTAELRRNNRGGRRSEPDPHRSGRNSGTGEAL